jgi:hypothetical protein
MILLREKVPELYTKNIEFVPENAEPKCLLTTAGAMRQREQ